MYLAHWGSERAVEAQANIVRMYISAGDEPNAAAELLPMAVKSESMNVFINDAGQTAVEASFARWGLCNRGSFDGDVTVVGRLRSGQYFYGRDSIKVIDRRMERVAVMAMYWLERCGRPDYCGGFDVNEDGVVNFADFVQVEGCCVEARGED